VATTTLCDLARRWKALDEEIKTLNKPIEALVRATAPGLVDQHGVGIKLARQFLAAVSGNAKRIRSEGTLANSAQSLRDPPAATATPVITGSAAAEIAPRTARSTSWPSSGCAVISPRVTTSIDGGGRAQQARDHPL
jgi:hypothetical protein